MALEKELEIFRIHRAEWIQQGLENRWVVIHAEHILGIFEDFEKALDAGYNSFGLDVLFLVKQITATDTPVQSSRRAIDAHCAR